MQTQVKTSQADSKPDRRFLQLALALQIESQKQLDELNQRLYTFVLQNSRGGAVQTVEKLKRQIKVAFGDFSDAQDALIEAYVAKLATARSQQAITEVIPLLRSVGAKKSADDMKTRTNNYSDDAKKRFRVIEYGDNKVTYNDRMYTLVTSGVKTVDNIITVNVARGMGSETLAYHLASYIDPAPDQQKARPWDVARQRFDIAAKFQPKGVLPGSFQTGVYNLSRTTAADTYRNATTDLYEDKWYVEGFDWVLSGSHPHTDVCDELAKASPYPPKGARPYSHPFCLCDYRVHLKSTSELRRLVQLGKFE